MFQGKGFETLCGLQLETGGAYGRSSRRISEDYDKYE